MKRTMLAGICCWMLIASVGQAQNERARVVRADKTELADDQSWIYNDLQSGREAARQSGRPMLILFRCVP